MVSRRWDPSIIIGISIGADRYHGDWKWGSLSRFLGFDMGVNRGIFGGIRKVSIRLYWNSISNVVNVESRIYKGSISGIEVLMVLFFVIEIRRHNQRLGFLGVWQLRYLGISGRRRNLGIENESNNLLRYRFMWENVLGEKKEKWWQYIRMLGSTLFCIILPSVSSSTFILFWVNKRKNGELVEKVETSKMVTSLDKTEEVMGHGVGDAVTETMEFNGTETDVEGKEEAKADEDEFQALTYGEVETVQVDTRDPKNVENEQGGIGDQSVQAEDDEKKKGARKALFKKTTAITMGTSKMRFVQAVLSPRKNAHAKPGKRHGGGDGARQTEDKGPLNPKPSSSKPWIKSQEVLWSDKWWGWGVFHYFLSISSMSISLLLGIGVLWHCFGRWVYVFLVLLVLVLCWNKLGAFIASTISSRSWLIGTVFGIPKIGYGRSGQMRSLVSSNRRLPYQALVEFGVGVQQRRYYGGKLVLGISRWFNEMGGD
ncbi:hypothetical protein F2Q68_00025264 [Brassica cretica]|uniref:Transmembrane protein n=1 Tax=Brassica cretica TaxID=69181 RepID=A0A8S9ICK2_BRACR|nr:hypothetical protein F2Q68_00025264 [Brassica cretica]